MVEKFLDRRFLKTRTDSENWPGEETVPALLNEISGEKSWVSPVLPILLGRAHTRSEAVIF